MSYNIEVKKQNRNDSCDLIITLKFYQKSKNNANLIKIKTSKHTKLVFCHIKEFKKGLSLIKLE